MEGEVLVGAARLEDLCEAIIDCEHKTAPTQPQGIPSIRTTNISNGRIDFANANKVSEETYVEWTARLEPQSGDLILAREAPVGEVGIIPPGQRACLGQRTVLIRTDKAQLHSRYLLYLLLTPEMRHAMRSKSDGCTVAHLNMSDIRILKLMNLPSLSEQHCIAHILGTVDDKIELNRRMNETLEAITRYVFKSWFVDFDPIRAKADGRRLAFMDAETAALFPDSFDDSRMGKIPKGWRVATVAELAELNALSLTKNDALELIEYIEISEVTQGNVGNISLYERGTEPSRARRRVRHGDSVLSTVRPDRGSYFLSLNPPESLIVSTGFAVVSPTAAPWSFMHATLTQPEVFMHLGQLADGGAYPAVNAKVIGAWEVVLPDMSAILEAFHKICAPLYERADCNRRENRVLADARDTLLPKLISGEIRVKDTEKFVGEHVR